MQCLLCNDGCTGVRINATNASLINWPRTVNMLILCTFPYTIVVTESFRASPRAHFCQPWLLPDRNAVLCRTGYVVINATTNRSYSNNMNGKHGLALTLRSNPIKLKLSPLSLQVRKLSGDIHCKYKVRNRLITYTVGPFY